MHPELSFEEVETTAFLLEELGKIPGLELHTPTRTGVVAVLKGAYPGRTIAIRGDIDALPIQEETELPLLPGCRESCMPAAMMAIRPCFFAQPDFWRRSGKSFTAKYAFSSNTPRNCLRAVP